MFKFRFRVISAVFGLGMVQPALAMEDLVLGRVELPTVLSATRLKQAPAEVPGSMTVLDRQLIRASGARDIPELLRLVPGMKIGYHLGNKSNVNYHGTNVTEARRLQVLVDGRSVYRPGLATVDWTDIPLAMEDIERIEVFRGPNTAAYGANALMGVINIISRDPRSTLGTRLKITTGNRGVQDLYGSHGTEVGNTHLRLSIFAKEDTGFDIDDYDREFRDDRRLNAFNLAGNTQLNGSQSLNWQVGAKEGTNQEDYDYDPMAPDQSLYNEDGSVPDFAYDRQIHAHYPPSDTSARDLFASARWTNDLSPTHSLQIKTYVQHMERLRDWRACDSPVVFSPELKAIFEVDPRLARRMNNYFRGERAIEVLERDFRNQPGLFEQAQAVIAQHNAIRDIGPTCWDLGQNLRESRFEVEIQDTLQLSDSLRSVFGSNVRYDRVASDTLFGGTVDNQTLQVFGNLEFRPHERWLLHAAGLWEDDQLIGDSFSPRLAVHFFLHPNHSLRAVYSEAVRSPDMYENNAYWTYTPTNLSGPPIASDEYYALAQGPGDLEQERMRSREIGYNGHIHQIGLSIDIKAFYDEISNMMSEPLQIKSFIPNNDNFARFTGAETQIDWQATRRDRLRLTYAYIDFVATRSLDQRLTARNSGSAAWLRQWPAGIESSLIYYGADKLNERRFERLDSRLAKRFGSTNRASMEIALTWQHRLDDEGLTWPENIHNTRNHYYLSAELSF